MKKSLRMFLNYFKKKNNKELHFLFSLVMVMVTIPLPKYSLSSQAIVLFVLTWLLLNPIYEKLILFKKNKKQFFVLSIPFWLYLFGLFFTDNIHYGISEFGRQMIFLIFPLVFSTIDASFIKVNKIIKYFPIGVFIAAFFGFCKASFFLLNDLGNYFYYDQFAVFLNKHTTYFSLFVVISILINLKNIGKNKKDIFNYIMLLFFILILYFLSVRISVIGLVAGALVLVYFKGNKKFKIAAFILIPLVVFLVFASPNFQKRFEPSSIENTQIEDSEFRILHWKAVLETITYNNLLIGNGSGSNRDYLYKKYREFKLTAAYEDEYNTHNQFLEILLDYGFIGLTLFILMLAYILKRFIHSKDGLAISIFVVLLVFMLTESILVRHSGAIMFSLFILLFMIKTQNIKLVTNRNC